LREQQVDADRMLEATQAALEADVDLLNAEELSDIQHQMRDLRQVVQSSDDPQAVEAAVQALARGTETFAARRMDRAVQRALAGQRIDDL